MKIIKKISIFLICTFMISNLCIINVEAKSNLKLNKTKTILYVGQNVTLKVNNATNKVKWSSSKKSVATVSSKGKVIAKKKGTTTITAKIGSKKLNCKVTVKNPYLSKTKVTVNQGKSITLKLNGSKAKTWTSSNKKIAIVNSKGKVTAKKSGTATITVKTINGKSYKCKIIVKKDDYVYPENPIQAKVEKELRTNGLITFTEGAQQAWDAGLYEEWGWSYEEVMADAPTFGAGYFIGYATANGDATPIVSTYKAYGHTEYYLEYMGKQADGTYKFKCYYG